eukprot:759071-Hanusia_phi.AAC.7
MTLWAGGGGEQQSVLSVQGGHDSGGALGGKVEKVSGHERRRTVRFPAPVSLPAAAHPPQVCELGADDGLELAQGSSSLFAEQGGERRARERESRGFAKRKRREDRGAGEVERREQ